MRGPTLSCPLSVVSGQDEGPPIPPEEQISAFRDEVLAAIPVKELARLEEVGALPLARRDAEIVGLYLARFWRFESPWWGDEALRKIFSDKLPITKAAELAHARAADLRLASKGQNKGDFLRQAWDDHTFFQVAAMREAGLSAREASQQAARWRDEFSDGAVTVKASTLELGYPRWAADPLRGKVWCQQLFREMAGLTAAEKTDLIQCNNLRAAILPPCPEGLRGERS